MDTQQIKQMLITELPDCEIEVAGGDGKFQVTAVGDVFVGLNPVRRQQKIYHVLNEAISSGAIHAVSMRLHTRQEADKG